MCVESFQGLLWASIPERESSRRNESRAEEAILTDDINTCANLRDNHWSQVVTQFTHCSG
jgi:hypothetical protein